jgi:hypothetical protein
MVMFIPGCSGTNAEAAKMFSSSLATLAARRPRPYIFPDTPIEPPFTVKDRSGKFHTLKIATKKGGFHALSSSIDDRSFSVHSRSGGIACR